MEEEVKVFRKPDKNLTKEELLQRLTDKGFSKEIIDAFSKIKREKFVLEDIKEMAYEDTALPIGYGQTISQPYTIATMLSMLELKKGQKVLEVGSGSGYVLAILSEILGKRNRIFGVERIEKLVKESKKNLKGIKNIKIFHGDGYQGLKNEAPFDRIIVSAACTIIPKKLTEQLKNNGILVLPLGSRYEQSLISVKKEKKEIKIKDRVPGFIFVPLVRDNEITKEEIN